MGRWFYIGAVDLHRGGGFTQGRWGGGAVDLHRGGGAVGGGAVGGGFTKCRQIDGKRSIYSINIPQQSNVFLLQKSLLHLILSTCIIYIGCQIPVLKILRFRKSILFLLLLRPTDPKFNLRLPAKHKMNLFSPNKKFLCFVNLYKNKALTERNYLTPVIYRIQENTSPLIMNRWVSG